MTAHAAGGDGSSSSTSKHVVIVMDATKDFSEEALQWALDNIVGSDYTLTLLGVTPWLNVPLSCKTWLDVWRLNLKDSPVLKDRSEWKSYVKYQKVRGIIELCGNYGVVPYMKVAMGYPSQDVVLKQTMNLQPTWVVFDRHYSKKRAFYAKSIPCNVVMMTSDGEVDMVKVQPPVIHNGENTSSTESPAW